MEVYTRNGKGSAAANSGGEGVEEAGGAPVMTGAANRTVAVIRTPNAGAGTATAASTAGARWAARQQARGVAEPPQGAAWGGMTIAAGHMQANTIAITSAVTSTKGHARSTRAMLTS